MSDYKYPDDLIKKTDARIQAQLVGNGIDSLSFNIKRQGLSKFSAHTDYTIECKIDTKEHAGKATKGKVVDASAIQSEIKQFISSVQDDDSTNSTIVPQIESLPLKGFGADKTPIQITSKTETFTCHTQCGSCAGKGQSECRICKGQTRQQCPMCHYTGELDCMTCQGRGLIDNNGKQIPCTYCQGRGRIYCTNCNGQKTISCVACNAKGNIPCKTCGGKGEATQITTITPMAMTKSQINVQELDNEPKVLVSKIGALNLAKGGHINIKTVKPPSPDDENSAAWYEDKPEVKKKTGVYYTVSVPWAVGEIIYNDKPYNISLVGNKGAVADAGSFMDAILKKPADIMMAAANGQGIVTNLLKDTCEYQVSRETLTSVVQGKTKQTMMELQKTYGIGLSKQFIQTFVKSAYTATKKITRRPRYIGLGVGLALSAMLYYFWFMRDGRDNFDTQSQAAQYAMDGLILIIGMIFTFGIIKGSAYFAMQSVLKTLNIQIKKIPAAGTAGIYGLIGCALIWGGLLAMQFI
jgi:hypothetical protein